MQRSRWARWACWARWEHPRPQHRDKVLPAQGPLGLTRDKTRPTRGFQRPIREKIPPASPKTPKLGCFQRAGRTFSRLRPLSGHAGRTISRTGHSDMTTLKPMTPLQPLMHATMRPPSPLLAPEQRPLKPTTPLQPKNARKTPISHPQRRRRFQLGHLTGPQRRWRFQLRLSLRKQRQQQFQTTAHLASGLLLRRQQAPMRPLLRKLACNSIERSFNNI